MLLLASRSPRRREILGRLGVPFEVRPSKYSEPEPASGARAEDAAVALALLKARGVERQEGDIVIGADTVVSLSGSILGKPRSHEQAREMLRSLSGRTHLAATGVAIISPRGEETFAETARVTFRPLTPELIEWYISTGEPMDKAGAYGIQGAGGRFVSRIEGDFYAVVGLPLCRLSQELERLGVIPGGKS